jgi:hypothetical protein
MARVFISYRRHETRWVAGRLYDRLAEVFGRRDLFLDVSDIEPGEDFVTRITNIVGGCDVLIAVIGPTWATMRDGAGRRRLDNPLDLVRLEIAAALARNVRVIPMLVDGAVMPEAEELPADLAPLARRNAHEVSFNRFHTDLDSFLRVLQRILGGSGAAPSVASNAAETRPAAFSSRLEPRAPAATAMPFTLVLETLGGVATPLISKGTPLPAEATELFSTAEDN